MCLALMDCSGIAVFVTGLSAHRRQTQQLSIIRKVENKERSFQRCLNEKGIILLPAKLLSAFLRRNITDF